MAWSPTSGNMPAYMEKPINSTKWKAIVNELYTYLNSLRTMRAGTVVPSEAESGIFYFNLTDMTMRIYDAVAAEWKVVGWAADLTAHTDGTAGAHVASAITNTPNGNLAATNVQGALNELQSDIDTRAIAATVTAYFNTATGHDHDGTDSKKVVASNVTSTASGNLAATDVQAALVELQADIDNRATASAVASAFSSSTGHDHDGTDSKKVAASNVTNTPAGNLAATDVQSALNELQGDITAHLSDTTDAHTAVAISVADSGNLITATTVEGALAELAQAVGSVDFAVVNDTTPQLGGNLDVNGSSIVSASDGNIIIEPNGTGKIALKSKTEFATQAYYDTEVEISGGTVDLTTGNRQKKTMSANTSFTITPPSGPAAGFFRIIGHSSVTYTLSWPTSAPKSVWVTSAITSVTAGKTFLVSWVYDGTNLWLSCPGGVTTP